MVKKLLLPEDVTNHLAQRYSNQHKAWLLGGGQWPLTVPLGVPTESDVAQDIVGVRRWVDAWSSWTGQLPISWVSRQWPRLGTQKLPACLELAGPSEVATVIGQERRWRAAVTRYMSVTQRWPQLLGHSVLGRHFGVLADYAEVDFSRLFAMLDWLENNPASGFSPRQLPVAGLDTKWLEKRSGVVTDILKAIRTNEDAEDFYSTCGLKRPAPRIRMKVLCTELRNKFGGLKDVEAPVADLAELSINPQRIIIVENLETGLALPDIGNTVAFMRLGHAVSLLAEIPWLRSCEVFYWGDIDTHGYAILNRARRLFPQTQSVMMNQEIINTYRELCVEESAPSHEIDLPFLTGDERAVFDGLRNGTWGAKLRLEQERIPWPDALAKIEHVMTT